MHCVPARFPQQAIPTASKLTIGDIVQFWNEYTGLLWLLQVLRRSAALGLNNPFPTTSAQLTDSKHGSSMDLAWLST